MLQVPMTDEWTEIGFSRQPGTPTVPLVRGSVIGHVAHNGRLIASDKEVDAYHQRFM